MGLPYSTFQIFISRSLICYPFSKNKAYAEAEAAIKLATGLNSQKVTFFWWPSKVTTGVSIFSVSPPSGNFQSYLKLDGKNQEIPSRCNRLKKRGSFHHRKDWNQSPRHHHYWIRIQCMKQSKIRMTTQRRKDGRDTTRLVIGINKQLSATTTNRNGEILGIGLDIVLITNSSWGTNVLEDLVNYTMRKKCSKEGYSRDSDKIHLGALQ